MRGTFPLSDGLKQSFVKVSNPAFDQINKQIVIQTLIIRSGTDMRSYAYNLVFTLVSNKILICALEVTHRDVLLTDQSGGCVQITS